MKHQRHLRSGSVLIAAVIFGLAISMAIAGYLFVATRAMKLANRTLHLSSAMNVAEAGIEEALFTLNKYQPTAFATPDPNAWANWTISGNEARRSFPKGYFKSSGQDSDGEFSILVTNYTTSSPVIVVRSRSWIKNENVIEKYLWASGGRRSFSDGGIIGEEINLNGNLVVNSYDSGDGPYGGSNVNDAGFVAATSINPVGVGNADVFGTVATGGSTPPQVNGQGYVGSYPAGTGYDPDNVSYGFQANFPPPPGFPTTGNEYTAPKTYASLDAARTETISPPSSDYFEYSGGIYYLGKAGATDPASFTFTEIASEEIVIRGPVRIQVVTDLTIKGTDYVTINTMPNLFTLDPSTSAPLALKDPTKAPFQIWIGGDMKLTGNGLANPYTIPGAAQIYGTGGDSQTIEVHGNTFLSAAIYAPNATVTMMGGGSDPNVYGGVIARVINMGSASVEYHCDEALNELKLGQFGVELLRELKTPAERAAYTF